MQTLINWWHRKLRNIDEDNVKDFSFDGLRVIAKVVDVYDGDSITTIFKFNGKYQKFKIRMDGYDSPEVRSSDAIEKEYGYRARDFLRNLISGKLVRLSCGKSDKYGRILGTVYTLSGVHVNEFMVSNKHGYPYHGGTKMKFSELHEYYGLKQKNEKNKALMYSNVS